VWRKFADAAECVPIDTVTVAMRFVTATLTLAKKLGLVS
jgi:hypothetical protein